MENEFAARGTNGLGPELAHVTAAEGGDAAAVGDAYAVLSAAFDTAEATVSPSAATIAAAVVELLRESAREYGSASSTVVLPTRMNTGTPMDSPRWRSPGGGGYAGAECDAAVFDQIAGRARSLAHVWPNLVPPRTAGRS